MTAPAPVPLLLVIITDVVNVHQLAGEARERKKKFSGSVEVLRFERTLELTRRQLRKTDNMALNDARMKSALALMFHDTKSSSSRSTSGGLKDEDDDHRPGATSSDRAVPSDCQTGRCQRSQEPADKYVTRDAVASSVVVTTASVATRSFVAMPTTASVAVASVAMVTASATTASSSVTQSFVAVTTSVVKTTATSTPMSVVWSTPAVSCASRPLNGSVSTVVAANIAPSAITHTASPPPSAVSVTLLPPPRTSVTPVNNGDAGTNSKYVSSVGASSNAVAARPVHSAAGKSTDSPDGATVTVGKSVDCDAALADAATRAPSVDSVAATSSRSVEPVTTASNGAVAGSSDGDVTAALRSQWIASPVPPSNVRSLQQSGGSPSPRGHVTFSDHVTEIEPGAGRAGLTAKPPRRVPPAPPPRAAIRNVTSTTTTTTTSRERPCSAVEPLATSNGGPGFPAVNGVVCRSRPLSMAPLATVDSDSDSAESQTGTIRRGTAAPRPDGAVVRGRTPPPVPTRKTSALTARTDGPALTQDAQYSNLHDVRLECARLERLDGAGQPLDGRPRSAARSDDVGAAAKCEETEIY